MRYQCHECDRRFDEPDIITETHGMTDGSCEKHAVCPYCHGWIEDLHECKICGATATEENLTLGVCNDCLMRKATVERCLKFGDDCEENVPINGFVVSLLSPRKINEILIKTISDANSIVPIDCFNFVLNDDIWFAQKVIEEEKENF